MIGGKQHEDKLFSSGWEGAYTVHQKMVSKKRKKKDQTILRMNSGSAIQTNASKHYVMCGTCSVDDITGMDKIMCV